MSLSTKCYEERAREKCTFSVQYFVPLTMSFLFGLNKRKDSKEEAKKYDRDLRRAAREVERDQRKLDRQEPQLVRFFPFVQALCV